MFRSKRDPAKLLGSVVARSTPPLARLFRKLTDLSMFGKPKLSPALACILTFCIVMVVIVDANVPFGYILVQLIRESDTETVVKVLLPIPIIGLVASSFIVNGRTRGVLTSVCTFGLVILWLLGLVLFAVYPMYPTPYPGAAKLLPAVTSVPFIGAVIGTMWHSIRNVFAWNAPQQIVGREPR